MDSGAIIFLSAIALLFMSIIVLSVLARLKGRIKIVFEDRTYRSGETISGKITVYCHKPVQAENLTVTLVCESIHKKNKTIYYEEQKELFGARSIIEKNKMETNFSVIIPVVIEPYGGIDLPDVSLMGVSIKDLVQLSANLFRVQWVLKTTLRAKGIDLHNVRYVSVSKEDKFGSTDKSLKI